MTTQRRVSPVPVHTEERRKDGSLDVVRGSGEHVYRKINRNPHDTPRSSSLVWRLPSHDTTFGASPRSQTETVRPTGESGLRDGSLRTLPPPGVSTTQISLVKKGKIKLYYSGKILTLLSASSLGLKGKELFFFFFFPSRPLRSVSKGHRRCTSSVQ